MSIKHTSLFLCLLCSSFMYSDDNSIPTNEINIFGLSYHLNDKGKPRHKSFNQVNPGIGYTRNYSYKNDSKTDFSITAAVYKNSYYHWTGVISAGPQYRFGNPDKFNWGCDIKLGLMTVRGICAPVKPMGVLIPTINVGYKNFNVYCAMVSLNAIGFFTGYKF